MKPKIILCLALVLGSVVILATSAMSQPVFRTYRSLEARVAAAECIVRGTVSNCSGIFIERKGGYFGGYKTDGTRRSDGVMRYTVTVQVDEVIKGTPARTLELVTETLADDKRFEQWSSRHSSFLFFIGDEESSNLAGNIAGTNCWSTIRLGEAVPAEGNFSSDHPVYLMDFTQLTNARVILTQTRKSAKASQNIPVTFHLFREIPRGPLWSSLLVPVQPPLEKVAKRLIAAPEDFVGGKDAFDSSAAARWQLAQLRSDGVAALRYFKSAANIKRLKSLLNDSDFYPARTGDATSKRFPVRSKAHEVLMAWGVDVPRPIFEEPINPAD